MLFPKSVQLSTLLYLYHFFCSQILLSESKTQKSVESWAPLGNNPWKSQFFVSKIQTVSKRVSGNKNLDFFMFLETVFTVSGNTKNQKKNCFRKQKKPKKILFPETDMWHFYSFGKTVFCFQKQHFTQNSCFWKQEIR